VIVTDNDGFADVLTRVRQPTDNELGITARHHFAGAEVEAEDAFVRAEEEQSAVPGDSASTKSSAELR